jgi:hypothetical protein
LAGVGILAIGWVAFGDISEERADGSKASSIQAPQSSASVSGAAQVSGNDPAGLEKVVPGEQPTSPATGYNLASFSEFQRNLLKRLWEIERLHQDDPFARWGVLPGPDFLKSEERQADVISLQTDGWVAVGPKKGVIYLTMRGIAFCKAHSSELDALKPAP